MDITILGIESSCDDTSAAVLRNNVLLSNVIASQAVHMKYGGVIPELASRAHQQNIIPVVDTALREAGLTAAELDAIAFTRGPGLLGSLLVGASFTMGLSIARNIPMVEVNHLQGHILSHFINLPDRTLPQPDFPFLCLLVSGGHTQIVRVDSPLEMRIIGTTLAGAAGGRHDEVALQPGECVAADRDVAQRAEARRDAVDGAFGVLHLAVEVLAAADDPLPGVGAQSLRKAACVVFAHAGDWQALRGDQMMFHFG